MSRSTLLTIVFIVAAIAIAIFVALSVRESPSDPASLSPNFSPPAIPQGSPPAGGGESASPEDSSILPDPAPPGGNQGSGSQGSGNMPAGNLPPGLRASVPPPVEVAPPPSDKIFVVPVVDETLQSLKQITEGELTGTEAREALLRSMSALEKKINEERAAAFMQALVVQNDLTLNKRVITSSSIYSWPTIRDQLRMSTDPGQMAALVHRESRLADDSAIDWLRHSQLEAPDDVFNGITRYMNNAATLIRNVDSTKVPDGDQQIIESLRELKRILRDSGGINLGEQLRGKIQGIDAERLVLYEALFNE